MNREIFLVKVSNLVADSMGKESGQLFFDFHKDESSEDIMDGARALLHDLMGPTMADKKLDEVEKES